MFNTKYRSVSEDGSSMWMNVGPAFRVTKHLAANQLRIVQLNLFGHLCEYARVACWIPLANAFYAAWRDLEDIYWDAVYDWRETFRVH